MNASKTLMSAIAAATIVGTVGFVSAQTTEPAAPSSQTTEPMNSPSTAPSQQMQQTPPASGSGTAPADMSSPGYVAPPADGSTATEPAPKADRN
jgi:hypothetical protein